VGGIVRGSMEMG